MFAANQQPDSATTFDTAGVPPAPPATHQDAPIAVRALEGEGESEYIALGCLRLDERNVRKDEPSEAEIDELADLIDAQGLLQNLAVVAYAEPMREKGKGKTKARTCTHGVIAGGRRLRALFRLVERKRLTLDEQILCRVVPEARAIAVSTAENSGRKAMSTADTVLAFADMVKAGAGVEDLAVSFHLSPLTVQRRLRLAHVAPSLFELFRQGQMTLDQLMALALTEDQTAQEAAWAAAPAHNRTPRALRALIAGEGLSQSIVRFVGIEAYSAAGGAVLRDLFADEGTPADHIQGPALMMRLAEERLQALAEPLRQEGLAWVETFTRYGYEESQQFASAPTTLQEPTPAEQEALEALDAHIAANEAELEKLYDDNSETDHSEQIDKLEEAGRQLDEQRDALTDARRAVAAEVLHLVGAVVHIDYEGCPVILRGQVRRADLAAARKAASKAASHAAGAEGGGGTRDEDSKGGVSDRLCHQLTAHRTRALQASMLGSPRAALAALVHPLLTRLVYGTGANWEAPSAVQARAEDCEGQLKTWAPDLAESRAEQLVQEALAEVRALLPGEPAELLGWLLAQEQDTLVRLLTVCSALSLNAINGSGKNQTSAPLAQALNLQMADWWAPTVGGYLGSVSKALIAEALNEAGLPEDAEAVLKLKKGEAAARAEELLAGRRWVPAVLR